MTRSPRELRSIESRHDLVEECVELYEMACQQGGSAEIEQFLPAPSDPERGTVALELMRIELEQSWRKGTPLSLEEYRVRFADVLEVPGRLEELAFEDYRCRCLAGQPVAPAEYSRRYAVDTVDWPSDTDRPLAPEEVETSVQSLREASQRLVDAIQPFPEVGDEFAGFCLLEKLGQGTFGGVFRARQADLASRDVVLKITAGVSREPQTMARLQHTNIVPVYSIHQRDTLRALCMPYFGRTTLADVVRRLSAQQPLPTSGQFLTEVGQSHNSPPSADRSEVAAPPQTSEWQELSRLSYVDACLRIAASLADALAHAHQRGILHRDIKPANVLLTDDGRPMLLDFNISEELEGSATWMMGGTLPYMSPEQRRAMVTGDRINASSDVYSFGVLLYQLLTGRRPDRAESPADESGGADWQSPQLPWGPMPAVRPVQAREIRQQNPRVPRSVAALVARCLQIEPERRPSSIAAVRDDLQRHLAHQPLRHAPDRSVSERMAKWARRHPGWLSGTTISLLAAVLLVTVSTLLLWRGRQLRESEALRQLDHLQQQLPAQRMVASAAAVVPLVRSEATATIRELLAPYGLTQSTDWRKNDLVRFLPPDERPQLQQQLAEFLYLLAAAESDAPAGADGLDLSGLSEAIRTNQLAQELFASGDVPAALRWQASAFRRRGDRSTDPLPSLPERRPLWNAPFEKYLTAQEYLRQLRFESAAELLEELRQREPLDYSTWFLLGNAYAGQTRLSEAEGCYTTCLTLWPQADMAYFNRGLCRMQMGRFAEAEEDFDHFLQLRGDLAAARVNRALCRKSQGNKEGAVTDLTQALQLGGPDPRVYLIRARVYDAMGETERAESDRQEGISCRPHDPAGWLARGLARVDSDPEAALADFRQAERLAPDSREALRNRAFVLAEHLQQPEEAIQVLSQLIDRDTQADDLMSRGVLRARCGQRDAAVADGQRALQLRSTDKLLFQLACVFALNCQQHPQDVQPALAHLAQAIGQNPRWIAAAIADPDLRALRDQTGFRSLLGAATVVQKMAVAPDSKPIGEAAPDRGNPTDDPSSE